MTSFSVDPEEFGWGDLLDPNVVRDFVWEGDDEEEGDE